MSLAGWPKSFRKAISTHLCREGQSMLHVTKVFPSAYTAAMIDPRYCRSVRSNSSVIDLVMEIKV